MAVEEELYVYFFPILSFQLQKQNVGADFNPSM